MAKKKFPDSQVPIRKSSDFLPDVFKTAANKKFLGGVFDPLVQPGVLQKTTGYIGRRYGKTFRPADTYLDTDQTLRSRYQLEPGVTVEVDQEKKNFYDYLDLKNVLNYFGNYTDRDDQTNSQKHYSWNAPIDWDKFVNYREYFWVPEGPDSVPVQGQNITVTSTYKVTPGIGSSWIFTPDGATNNPTIVLYRGQTYRFEVNSPLEGFVIRQNYDTGSLIYNPLRFYQAGEYAIFDNKLWRAKVDVEASDGSTITVDSQDWELIDSTGSTDSLVFNEGVTNNGAKRGIIEWTVPLNAPELIYYQSDTDPNRLGQFVISDIEDATFIDVEKEISGKKDYTSANGVKFTNGLVVEFRGLVEPAQYATGNWLVEGVGTEIHLTQFTDLVPPQITNDNPDVIFDNEGFDTKPFDDATQYAGTKDYLVINRNSKDSNPWSRYNRWFHRSVLEYAASVRNTDFEATESARAKRPIIEFNANIQLFNHGGVAKQTVDYIDDYTTDIFSNIEGSTGYSVDGEFLFEGARVLVTNDTDILANNKIYTVRFIDHNGNTQINLREADDATPIENECVLIRRGTQNAGKMYHYDGQRWNKSQEKLKVNQYPLFDLYDASGTSFSNQTSYPVSTFTGSKILSYAEGNGRIDNETGLNIKYLNIDNVGDIVFDWNLDKDSFSYAQQQETITIPESIGYFKINDKMQNGWIDTDPEYLQPIIDSVTVIEDTNIIDFSNTIDWTKQTNNSQIIFYKNGEPIVETPANNYGIFTFAQTFVKNDVVSIKIVDDVSPNLGYYEFPVGVEKNPLNSKLKEFTLGQSIDHIKSCLEFNTNFSGTLPGLNNLRDISDYQKHGKRFLKHSGIAAGAIALLSDKNWNVIKSIQYAKSSYTTFKENFIKKAGEIDFEEVNADFVDAIIQDLSKTKSIESPFADSDMIGAGAYTSIDYTVEDTGITTFALSESFSTTVLSRRAVYVYINNNQLLLGTDYTIDATFGFVRISKTLFENDQIQIREYASTSFSHIPPTPTALGLYKKYTPKKYLDESLQEPRNVIQGHDGSITVAYDDYRDDILLELEYRIYNNIKNNYDENVFNIDAYVGGYYGNAQFKKQLVDDIVSQEFLKWIANTNLNYTLNSFFEDGNPYTYTYSEMTDRPGNENLPGWWRGVYKYFYDTDRPHTHPWEMQGFTEKPSWWDEEYGEAPYTNGNLILWDDIRDGIIRQGDRAGTYPRYARTSIRNHLPVDADGNLLDPLTSGLAGNFTLFNNKGGFKLGDYGPVENAWRTSAEYPFAMTIAMCLLKPFEFIISNFDRYKTTTNILGQIIDKDTGTFITPSELILPIAGFTQTSGLANYIASYIKGKGQNVADIQAELNGINVRLSSRLSGFVDKEQQRYLLDSKNPSSTSSSIFIPTENYDILFDVSAPTSSLTYSGIIFEKTASGWTLAGYDNIKPYFEYWESVPNQKDPTIIIGGVSVGFTVFDFGLKYTNGQIVEYRGSYYRVKESFTAGDEFDESKFTKLPDLPVEGAITAQRRRNFNKTQIKRLSYGTQYNTIQEVADFILGHQEYLKDQGFLFDNYDGTTQSVQDWTTSLKEFMFWTQHNWAVGSLLTVSPGAQKLTITTPVGVAANLLDTFYDYNILGSNGSPLDYRNIDVLRDFQTFTITTTDTTEGMYYLKVNTILKEHVVVFDDRTVFNDVLFDKTSGYRQERIKTNGYRTTDWDGDYTSPGFLFDNVNIASWQQNRDYKLGDIVKYRADNFTSLLNHTSGEQFDDNKWSLLDSTPEKRLVPNFDYRINSIEDYFDVDTDGLSKTERELARHTVGYQTRQYLEQLAEDPVTQFKIYQGMIREKGTSNPITKIFDKRNNAGSAGVNLDEEWAFKVGTMGGADQSRYIELGLNIDNFKLNPQPVIITDEKGEFLDKYYRVNQSNFDYTPVPYTNNVTPLSANAKPLKTAGYVKLGQTDYTVRSREDIPTIDVASVKRGEHVWITFDKQSWSVIRIEEAYHLPIAQVDTDQFTVEVIFDKRHGFNVDDYIGIRGIEGIDGFYKIDSVTPTTITFTTTEKQPKAERQLSTSVYPIYFEESRFANYNLLTDEDIALLPSKGKLFIDSNDSSKWEVVEKNSVYDNKKITNYGLTDPRKVGEKVVYSDILKQTFASASQTPRVMIYLETTQGLSVKQILQPPDTHIDNVLGSFGLELALSPDSKWLAVGSPFANGLNSNYRGEYSPFVSYGAGNIVLYAGKLYEAINPTVGDGSSISVYNSDWRVTRTVEVVDTGVNDGYTQQGVVHLYKYAGDQWVFDRAIISPRQFEYEHYGKSISLSLDNNGVYHMVVSAPGSLHRKGRVYIYSYDATNDKWQLDTNEKYFGEYNPGEIFFEGVASPTVDIDGNARPELQISEIGDSTPLMGKIEVGARITGEGVPDGTIIVAQDSGTPGGEGVYLINKSFSTASVRMNANYYYPTGSIVFYNGSYWEAQADNYGDGSTISIDSNDWLKLDPIASQGMLPQSVALEDDGSSLYTGLLNENQVAELVMNGHEFGTVVKTNYTGDTLVVGAPDADGTFFPNYKGIWRPDYEYMEGDIVKFNNSYHRLTNIGPNQVPADSTIRSYNEEPVGYPWVDQGDSTEKLTGKIFIYKKNTVGTYELTQTITADNLSEISDIEEEVDINIGDKFGYDISIDYSANQIVVTSPQADINFQNQGAAFVFRYESDSSVNRYRLKQKLQSFDKFPNEFFGQSICMSANQEIIAVGANNSPYNLPAMFDNSQTAFDQGRTTFRNYEGFSGSVYVFERKADRYLLTEKLDAELSLNESFGNSISCDKDIIVVGSPDYIEPLPHGVQLAYEGEKIGTVRHFKKPAGVKPLTVLSTQADNVDIEQIKRVAIFEKNDDVKLTDLEYFDPAKLKILNAAERELSFKVPYDPAVYSVGTEDVTVDNNIAWNSGKNVGKLWWNIGNAKWIDYEQGDMSYRVGNWGTQAVGSTIDIYEWVSSPLLPSEWSVLADTTEGLLNNISGQPLYPNDDVYSVKVLLDPITGLETSTTYFYWVRNKTIVPNGVVGRNISASAVANLINNPVSAGNTLITFVDSNKFVFYNYRNQINVDDTILNIEYYNNKDNKNAVHNEYMLITEGVADSLPNAKLEHKWIDSLIGYDLQGNRIPDTSLPVKQRYGISFRPRQSMFIDKRGIAQITIEKINTVLKKEAFADTINYTTLNSKDELPSEILKLYDTKVDFYEDLENVGTTRVKKAVLSVNLVDNAVNSINILDPGYGYKVAPDIEFEGDGVGAVATTTIDNQGRINSVNIINGGAKYRNIIAKIREFSVLVENDSTANNFWSIYAWDDQRQVFFRSRSQSYDTTRYWSKVDWWQEGYGSTSRIVREILSVYQEPTVSLQIGDLLKIKEYGAGGWAVFEKVTDNVTTVLLGNYKLIGRQNGTIEFSDRLWNTKTSGIGFDIVDAFDAGLYDKEVALELRNILNAVKNEIFIADYAVEWNSLFFAAIRYVFKEQTYVDWAFKTSFLNATHNIGTFKTTPTYKGDNLESYLQYINEVKPYRTTVREFISKYDNTDNAGLQTTDFDLPPVYDPEVGALVNVDENNELIDTFPYKNWKDNKGYSITSIIVSDPGKDYTTVPTIVIEGNGTGAKAKAYISNGKVSGVSIVEEGKGYTGIPKVSIVGGNGSSAYTAKAVAVLGNGAVRTINITQKFDRITKEGTYQNFNYEQTFTASGSSSVFELLYPCSIDKSKITILKDDQLVLEDEYIVELYNQLVDGYSVLKAKITFKLNPVAGSVIKVTYEKNDNILDAVSRITKFYNPGTGMKGTDKNQLMTGIDFGGVLVQGTTFDVTGGWDALPWFTDSWDSVEAAADFYVVCDGSTNTVTLPYVPEEGQEINVYLKRAGEEVLPDILNLQLEEGVKEPPTVRIDDPNYDDNWDSSVRANPNAQMPTFYGDGSTKVIEIGDYVSTNDGDILIFRPSSSDGSVTINDPNIVDTNITGGTLSNMAGAYTTATGKLAEEIQIDGSGFVTPENVPAPEEQVPGQVLDSVSIKVFQKTDSGAATLSNKVALSDGSTATYDIGQNIINKENLIVYVDSIKQELGTNYTINIAENSFTFNTAPAINSLIEIISVGLGGLAILDYKQFTADGETLLYLTQANYTEASTVYVTVDGIQTDAGFVESSEFVTTAGKALVQFGTVPARNSTIKIVVLGAATDVDSSLSSVVRVNNQQIIHDGSTTSYDLDKFVALTRESATSSMVVELNGKKLKGVDTVYAEYDGGTKDFTIGVDPFEAPGAVLPQNLRVFVNGLEKDVISDWIYSSTLRTLTYTGDLVVGDKIKIENNLRAEYSTVGNNLQIASSVTLNPGDIIDVTWFGEYPSMKIVQDVHQGGKVKYRLPFKPINISYIWVYRNGDKLETDSDYYIDLERQSIYLNDVGTTSDIIEVVSFGSEIYRLPSAWEIHKDMLNVTRYNRYCLDDEVTLAADLKYYDQTITVSDASNISHPIPSKNIPGVVSINNEKIEFMVVEGNTLKQLRRGAYGTGIADTHLEGSLVSDLGKDNTIGYTDDQIRQDFVSDGSSQLIGPLEFVPQIASDPNWFAGTIPEEYGRCDSIEVFAGGKRLRKTSLTIFDEALGSYSPIADKTVEAEFAVDGTSAYIRLTSPVSAGTRISIIRKVGNTWYDRGTTTATTGATLLENSTPISRFIADKSTRLPE